jgi:hypothetical protein
VAVSVLPMMRVARVECVCAGRVLCWGFVLGMLVGLRYMAMAEVYSVGGSPGLISGRRVDVSVPGRRVFVFEYPCDDWDDDGECGCVICRREFYQL